MSIATIILAAGRGKRAGGSIPKQYTTVGHVTLIRHTVEVFLSHSSITKLVLVIHPDDNMHCKQILSDIINQIVIINGGSTRQKSSYAALQYLRQTAPSYVHIHDVVRPFVNHQLLNAIHRAITPSTGVLLAIPVTDTLKKVDDDKHVIVTVPNSKFFAAQTPQSFPYPLILAAHEAAHRAGRSDFTDDSSIAEWYNIPMQVVAGSSANIKITWAKDLEMIDQYFQMTASLLPDVRTGNGYDVHKLVPGDSVILCGVKIPCDKKLFGHSDADVALHALTDALLATQGAGDIGMHFPSSDPKWKNVQSAVFVQHAVGLIHKKNGHISNIDITLISETPKISYYRVIMIQSLQNMLGISAERISLKATTNETLGFIGRKEGIAAIATATVIYGKKISGIDVSLQRKKQKSSVSLS